MWRMTSGRGQFEQYRFVVKDVADIKGTIENWDNLLSASLLSQFFLASLLRHASFQLSKVAGEVGQPSNL
jgi:hypothetical protein